MAQAPAPASPLSLEAAISRSLTDNPELRAAGLDVDIERMRRDSAAMPPPLSLDAELENFAGSGVAAGFDGAEITLGVSRRLERGGKAELRRDVGERRIDQATGIAETLQLAVVEATTLSFTNVLALQERVELARQAIEIAGQTLSIVSARVDVGRSPEAERATARVALARTELAGADVERQLETARMRLASLWGAARPDFARVEGDLRDLPVPSEDFDALSRRLDANPELVRRAARLRIEAAESRLAAAQRQPDLALAGGLRHLGQQDDLGLVFSVSMPFGSDARARPGIEAADLALTRAPLTIETERRALHATLFALHQELSFSRAALEALRKTIIPEAENAVSLYSEAFAVGSSTLLELIDAQNRLLVLRTEAVTTAGDYHAAFARVRYLLGGQLEIAR